MSIVQGFGCVPTFLLVKDWVGWGIQGFSSTKFSSLLPHPRLTSLYMLNQFSFLSRMVFPGVEVILVLDRQ